MIPSLDFSSLKEAHWWQFAVRFFLGGAVTVCTGLIAQRFGPVVGGLFLAFPAIFPATATLIERHETEKKSKAGIDGRARGRKAAALDAAGAVLGGWGMLCFGCAAWLALPRYSMALALAWAALLWLIVSASLWWGRRHWGR
jgi:Protein of unknown function (DUF3147)